MTIVGGLRARLIEDSLVQMITDSLRALGWMDPARQHLPLNIIDEPVDPDVEIPLNTIAFEASIVSDKPAEVGSNLTEDRWPFYIDVYAESKALGTHLSNDIRDILRGKFPSIGRTGPVLDVYDLRQATPPWIFGCVIENVRCDKGHNWPQPWRQHWYSISLDLIDTYDDEDN